MSRKNKHLPMRKPENTSSTIKRLLKYIGENKGLLVLVFFFIIISTGATITGTFLLKPVINDYILPLVGQEHPDLVNFVKILLFMAVVYIVGVFAGYMNNKIMLNVSTKTLYKIRRDLFSHMEKLPISFFDKHSHGEIMSLYTNDTDTLRDMLSQALPQLMSSILTVIATFTMMLCLSPVLTLVVILMISFMVFITGKVGKHSVKAFKAQQENMGKVNGYIEEMIEGQKVVKVFTKEDDVKEHFNQLNEALCQAGTRANTLANILMPIINNLSHVSYALNAMIGVVFVILGKLDLGTIVAFLQYVKSFTMPVNQMAQLFNSILNSLAGAERIFKFIDSPVEENQGKIRLEESPKGKIQIKNLDFSYDGKKTVLHNINLTALPGQKVALVGSTGSGKTTITSLINRFYDVPDGKIFYDDVDINKIDKFDLRRSLAVVLQDIHLFTGTIGENISYGKLDATQEEIEKAAKLANADYFIRHLKNGYNTLISGDGSNLSQGQRQLLAIARTAITNPAVLILDEATSSIDTRTEALIQKGMDRLMEGRTVFVIAHRLSTVRNADKILVLENGRIIEEGNHQELISQKGRYYQLYTGAFEME